MRNVWVTREVRTGRYSGTTVVQGDKDPVGPLSGCPLSPLSPLTPPTAREDQIAYGWGALFQPLHPLLSSSIPEMLSPKCLCLVCAFKFTQRRIPWQPGLNMYFYLRAFITWCLHFIKSPFKWSAAPTLKSLSHYYAPPLRNSRLKASLHQST